MKYNLTAFVFFIAGFHFVFGQVDTAKLMTEISQKLNNRSATVSSVLSDSAYDMLHPKTSFRKLIEKHAASGILVITNENEPGKKIKVIATIKNKDDQPVAGALIYLYQTDARGWYAADAPHVLAFEGDIRHARIFGYGKTDRNGQLELHTVKPSGYPRSDLPAHIHVHVMAEGYRPYGTEFLFDDDERLTGRIREQSIRSQFLIAKPASAEAPFSQKFIYSLELEKN